jgi:branched-chain amino acid transport system permease protein
MNNFKTTSAQAMKRILAKLSADQKAFLALIFGVFIFPVFIKSAFILTITVFIALYGINAVGATLTMGYAGQLLIAFPFYNGLGAYTFAILTTAYRVNPWVALGAGVILAGSTAYFLGLPIVRLGFLYMGMVTFGVIVIGQVLMGELSITHGHVGIWDIPSLSVGGFVFDSVRKNYYLVWIITLGVLATALNLVNSRTGRGLKAIASNEQAASAMGINIQKAKNQAHVFQAIYSAIAGGLYANFVAFVDPSGFGIPFAVYILMMVCVGGMFSVWGALFGAFLVTVLLEILRTMIPLIFPGAETGQFEMIFYGIGLIVVLIYMPDGLIGSLSGVAKLVTRRRLSQGSR